MGSRLRHRLPSTALVIPPAFSLKRPLEPSMSSAAVESKPALDDNSKREADDDKALKPNPTRPPIRNPHFDLEPNPFEQSFSRSSNSVVKTSDDDTPASKHRTDNPSGTGSAASGSDAPTKDSSSSSPKPTLPPLAALASPGPRTFAWGLTSAGLTGHNSLRSGPLSPAMLSGPTNATSSSAFDHNSFRTGLTPGTGLTPLVGGPASFPPPSPNTAAFLEMVTGTGNTNTLASVTATITPNTLSALTGTLNNGIRQGNEDSRGDVNQMNYEQQQVGQHHGHYPYGETTQTDSNAQNSAATAATTAANGLFLLSQAHQELTKREEAQARAGSKLQQESNIGIVPSATNKRGSKRKGEENTTKVSPKKAKGGRKKKEETPSDSDDEELESPVFDELSQKNIKDMTDEEKRKNFLERNRQAALKCRQRKKAWLTQLQAKVEFLSTENERLTTALVSSREEISRLNALVGAPQPPHMQGSHHQGSNGTHLGQSQQPISVAVSIPGSGKNGVVSGHANHQVGVGNGNAPPVATVTAVGSGRGGYGY